MQRLRESAVKFSETFPNAIYGKLDVFGGDGWQLLMSDQKRSLRAALFLRAQVRSFNNLKLNTRIAVAWGAVDKETLNAERISESTGEAFTESGRALKNMKKSCKLTLHHGQYLSDLSLLKNTISFIDEIANHWTPIQAQTISFALLNQSQEMIAVSVGKSQPTIHQALHSGGWHSIEDFLKEIEYRLENL
ncbi:hypothetical protein HQ585_16345 [candidate division KSB1 bacterium]|nr:hypothetical protein [candidate division KSB1 bacterium]